MTRIAGRVFAALILCVPAASAIAADRPADEIVKEIEAIKRPTTYAEYQEGNAKKVVLIAELQKAHPADSRLETLLPQRWMALAQTGKGADALPEIDKALASSKSESLKKEGLFTKGQILMMTESPDAIAAVDAFAKAAPADRRVPALLFQISSQTADAKKKVELEERIIKDFDNSPYAGMIKGLRKQRAAIGKPFELEFTEATKGTTVSMKELKGKVVVLDFWATWCGPCIAEMPKMKSLYAEYKEKGVEFIGVSLDQPKEKGGLDKLKKYVADNQIAWPQYYQGNYWQSEFSSSWGINSIPCVFIVDTEGKLYSTEARGKLEKLIPELLKKAKTNGAGE